MDTSVEEHFYSLQGLKTWLSSLRRELCRDHWQHVVTALLDLLLFTYPDMKQARELLTEWGPKWRLLSDAETLLFRGVLEMHHAYLKKDAMLMEVMEKLLTGLASSSESQPTEQLPLLQPVLQLVVDCLLHSQHVLATTRVGLLQRWFNKGWLPGIDMASVLHGLIVQAVLMEDFDPDADTPVTNAALPKLNPWERPMLTADTLDTDEPLEDAQPAPADPGNRELGEDTSRKDPGADTSTKEPSADKKSSSQAGAPAAPPVAPPVAPAPPKPHASAGDPEPLLVSKPSMTTTPPLSRAPSSSNVSGADAPSTTPPTSSGVAGHKAPQANFWKQALKEFQKTKSDDKSAPSTAASNPNIKTWTSAAAAAYKRPSSAATASAPAAAAEGVAAAAPTPPATTEIPSAAAAAGARPAAGSPTPLSPKGPEPAPPITTAAPPSSAQMPLRSQPKSPFQGAKVGVFDMPRVAAGTTATSPTSYVRAAQPPLPAMAHPGPASATVNAPSSAAQSPCEPTTQAHAASPTNPAGGASTHISSVPATAAPSTLFTRAQSPTAGATVAPTHASSGPTTASPSTIFTTAQSPTAGPTVAQKHASAGPATAAPSTIFTRAQSPTGGPTATSAAAGVATTPPTTHTNQNQQAASDKGPAGQHTSQPAYQGATMTEIAANHASTTAAATATTSVPPVSSTGRTTNQSPFFSPAIPPITSAASGSAATNAPQNVPSGPNAAPSATANPPPSTAAQNVPSSSQPIAAVQPPTNTAPATTPQNLPSSSQANAVPPATGNTVPVTASQNVISSSHPTTVPQPTGNTSATGAPASAAPPAKQRFTLADTGLILLKQMLQLQQRFEEMEQQKSLEKQKGKARKRRRRSADTSAEEKSQKATKLTREGSVPRTKLATTSAGPSSSNPAIVKLAARVPLAAQNQTGVGDPSPKGLTPPHAAPSHATIITAMTNSQGAATGQVAQSDPATAATAARPQGPAVATSAPSTSEPGGTVAAAPVPTAATNAAAVATAAGAAGAGAPTRTTLTPPPTAAPHASAATTTTTVSPTTVAGRASPDPAIAVVGGNAEPHHRAGGEEHVGGTAGGGRSRQVNSSDITGVGTGEVEDGAKVGNAKDGVQKRKSPEQGSRDEKAGNAAGNRSGVDGHTGADTQKVSGARGEEGEAAGAVAGVNNGRPLRTNLARRGKGRNGTPLGFQAARTVGKQEAGSGGGTEDATDQDSDGKLNSDAEGNSTDRGKSRSRAPHQNKGSRLAAVSSNVETLEAVPAAPGGGPQVGGRSSPRDDTEAGASLDLNSPPSKAKPSAGS